MIKKLFAIVLASSAWGLASPVANAADISDPGYDWNGFYAGVHGGYLWSNTDVTDLGVLVEHNANTHGFVGGILAGHNWQNGQWIWGIDADLGLSNARGHGGVLPPVVTANRYDMNWDGHARLRFGMAPNQGPLFLYVAGGLAIADFKFKSGETGETKRATYFGPTIGAGAEYAFSEAVTGRLEYLFDYYGGGSGVVVHDYHAKLKNASTIRAAVSFKF